jgi:hypothetical protein
MIIKAPLAIALMAAFAAPAFAQDAMKPAGAMSSGDAMMAAPMKPMSQADKVMMAKCHKMKPSVAAKNAKCAKLMAMHANGHM